MLTTTFRRANATDDVLAARSTKRKRNGKRLGIPILAACILCGAGAAQGDPVTDWNEIMQTTVSVLPTNAALQSRWGAIVQLAVFEAVNAIVGDYEPYLGVIEAPLGASPDAAAIAAAHRTLATLRPGSAAVLDFLRVQSLAVIPDGPAKEAGIAAGEEAAAAMLLLRADDGSAGAEFVPYTVGTAPGEWRPVSGFPAHLPGWGLVTPFGLTDGAQFRLSGPPALRTGLYASDYNEVKLLGRATSLLRPPDRTNVVRFHAFLSPVQTWNPAARQASVAQGKTLSENARIFALLGMALADSSIAAFDTGYHYNLWRPTTAIREGDSDPNKRTFGDPTWLPLIVTPPFPGYASVDASCAAAARLVLERSFGKDGHDIALTSPGLPGTVVHYTAWEQITDDIDDARIYGGLNFRFDQEAGAHQGRSIGLYIIDNHLCSVDELVESGDDE